MTKPNQNQPTNPLIKSVAPAAVLGAIAIGLFVLFYMVLSQNNVAPFPRLILSFCAPPALLAILLGLYILFGPGRNRDS